MNRLERKFCVMGLLVFLLCFCAVVGCSARYTVEFDSCGGSEVSAVAVGGGGKIAAPIAPTRDNLAFGGWFKESECINEWNFYGDMVGGNITLYAKWNILYIVTFDSGGGSGVGEARAVAGDLLAAPQAPERSGFLFGGWFKDSEFVGEWNFYGDTVTSDMTLYAKWLKLNRVSFDSLGGSLVEELGGGEGTEITAVSQRSGFSFDGWYDSDRPLQNGMKKHTVIPAVDMRLYAAWRTEGTSENLAYGYSGGNAVVAGNSDAADVIIPTIAYNETVRGIAAGAFKDCDYLKSITLPENIVVIGAQAFKNCVGLTGIVVPSSVTHIGKGAFEGCGGLTSINVPFVGENSSGIGESYFGHIFGASNYSEVTSPYVPISLKNVIVTSTTRLSINAFSACSGIASIKIPDNVTDIGNYAFRNCYGLASLVIPKNVTGMGYNVFSGWTENQTLYIAEKSEPPNSWNINWLKGCGADIIWRYII